MDAIQTLAEHVTATGYGDLPDAAVAATKTFLLDSIGVGVVGDAGPWVAELIECQSQWGTGTEASVWGREIRLPAPAAAMCNAYQVHNSEFDCIHEGAVVHPMAVALPAALAHAERAGGVTGKDFAVALALGVDVACNIGLGSRARMAFFRPGTAGAFGATAAIGKLMGFDAATLVNAMGITYSQLCGTMQAHTESSPLLGMQAGFNARNAVVACDMAARGLVGPQNVLEGPYGYYRLFEGDYDLSGVLRELGTVWRIAETAHKPFPSGRATHGVIDALMQLRTEYGFSAADVEAVTAYVPPLTHQLVARPIKDDMAVNYARLSAAYTGARALIAGRVVVEDFAPAMLADPETLALGRRIEVVVDDNPDGNALTPIMVIVMLAGGRRCERTLEIIYGNPANPMRHADHLEKFRHNWRSGAVPLDADNAETMIAAIDDLESLADTRDLIALIS